MREQDSVGRANLVAAGSRAIATAVPLNPLVSRGLADLATNCLSNLTGKNAGRPGDALLHYKHGMAHLHSDEFQEAIQEFDQAIRLDPDCHLLYCWRGHAWLSKGNRDASCGDFVEAIRDFDRAIRLDQQNAEYYLDRGRAWSSLGGTITRVYSDGGADGSGEALQFDPRDAFDRAEQDFDEVIRLGPESVLAMASNVGKTLLSVKRHLQHWFYLEMFLMALEQQEPSEREARILANPVTALGLSKRARKGLKRLGIESMGDLLSRTADQLLEQKNFGMVCLDEVREKLHRLGLKLQSD